VEIAAAGAYSGPLLSELTIRVTLAFLVGRRTPNSKQIYSAVAVAVTFAHRVFGDARKKTHLMDTALFIFTVFLQYFYSI